MIKSVLLLLRPHQWLKNLFIFLPLFFDKHLGDLNYLFPTMIVFFAFSFAASSIYCFNDIQDVETDRLHVRKCKRPIASGTVSLKKGYIIMIVLFCLSVCLTMALPNETRWTVLEIILLYYFINVAYCIKLRQIELVDMFVIAIGFVLRVLAGGFSTQIWISKWIILMTFLLALFLAFAKRRDDVVSYIDTGVEPRKNISRYNLDFMNQSLSIIASITMVCYIMYSISEDVIYRMGTQYVYITSVFVLAGIIRYLQLTIVDTKSGNPTQILMKDRFIQICIAGWIITFFFIIYN